MRMFYSIDLGFIQIGIMVKKGQPLCNHVEQPSIGNNGLKFMDGLVFNTQPPVEAVETSKVKAC